MAGHVQFSCLFVCLSVCLSVQGVGRPGNELMAAAVTYGRFELAGLFVDLLGSTSSTIDSRVQMAQVSLGWAVEIPCSEPVGHFPYVSYMNECRNQPCHCVGFPIQVFFVRERVGIAHARECSLVNGCGQLHKCTSLYSVCSLALESLRKLDLG